MSDEPLIYDYGAVPHPEFEYDEADRDKILQALEPYIDDAPVRKVPVERVEWKVLDAGVPRKVRVKTIERKLTPRLEFVMRVERELAPRYAAGLQRRKHYPYGGPREGEAPHEEEGDEEARTEEPGECGWAGDFCGHHEPLGSGAGTGNRTILGAASDIRQRGFVYLSVEG